MPAICTNTDVFQFCGTPTDVQTTQGSAVTALIINVQDEVDFIAEIYSRLNTAIGSGNALDGVKLVKIGAIDETSMNRSFYCLSCGAESNLRGYQHDRSKKEAIKDWNIRTISDVRL